MAAPLVLSGNGSAYVRISDDKQDADRQRTSAAEFQVRHGVVIRPEFRYEDLGWSRSDARHRPEFQRLLRDVEEGLVQWIIIDRPDRFGAANKFELFSYLHRLNEANCRLYTVDGKELTSLDTADGIHTYLDADQSERELHEKSVRVIEAMRQRAAAGQWMGGRIPYGLDVVAFRLAATGLDPQWRVKIVRFDLKVKVEIDGRRREFHGTSNFPPTEQGEFLQLRPGDDEQIAAVRWMFQSYAEEAISFDALARTANRQHLPAPAYAKGWTGRHVQTLLGNPIYVGRPAWNRKTSGSYNEWKGGQRVKKKPNTPQRQHDESDWVLGEQIFEPLVPLDLWQRVQAKLKGRGKRTQAPKSAAAWLAGLVFCGRCGRRMSTTPNYSNRGPTYLCTTYIEAHKRGEPTACAVNAVTHKDVEAYLRKYLDVTGTTVADLAGPAKLIGSKQVDAFRAAVDRARAARKKMAEVAGLPSDDEQLVERYQTLFDTDGPKLRARLDQLRPSTPTR